MLDYRSVLVKMASSSSPNFWEWINEHCFKKLFEVSPPKNGKRETSRSWKPWIFPEIQLPFSHCNTLTKEKITKVLQWRCHKCRASVTNTSGAPSMVAKVIRLGPGGLGFDRGTPKYPNPFHFRGSFRKPNHGAPNQPAKPLADNIFWKKKHVENCFSWGAVQTPLTQ